jgi:Rod binding domain-containing protein
MTAFSAISPSLSSALPPINPATEPASIRHGGPAAQKAYQEALGFEDILVNQLSQELASTVSSPGSLGGAGDDGSDSSAGGSGGSGGGLLGSDPSTSAFSSMIPQALTTSIMSGGGLGIAARLAQAIDPSIGEPQGAKK